MRAGTDGAVNRATASGLIRGAVMVSQSSRRAPSLRRVTCTPDWNSA